MIGWLMVMLMGVVPTEALEWQDVRAAFMARWQPAGENTSIVEGITNGTNSSDSSDPLEDEPTDGTWWWKLGAMFFYKEGPKPRGGSFKASFPGSEWKDLFSTEERAGRMATEGGWALYLLDKMGKALFGAFWPTVAWGGMTAVSVALVALISYGVQTALAPCRWMCTLSSWLLGCCSRRNVPEGDREAALLLAPGPKKAQQVQWVGPAAGAPTETTYYQKQIRGRGASRRFNHILIRVAGQVARLEARQGPPQRIDRHGLMLPFGKIHSASSRAFRKEVGGAQGARGPPLPLRCLQLQGRPSLWRVRRGRPGRDSRRGSTCELHPMPHLRMDLERNAWSRPSGTLYPLLQVRSLLETKAEKTDLSGGTRPRAGT